MERPMNNSPKQKLSRGLSLCCLCAAALAAGCSHTADNANDESKNTVPKPVPPAVSSTASDQTIPPPLPTVAPTTPTVKAPKISKFSVSIVPENSTVRLTGKAATAITVHNTGPDIPALSLWFDGTGPTCTIRDIRSDRSAHPDPAMVDRGQGWDFGPLPHGKTTHIKFTIAARTPGAHVLVIKPFAIAEDEGDTERTIDQHIEGADTKLTALSMVH